MSRFNAPHTTDKGLSVAYGFDRMLSEYFAYYYDDGAADDPEPAPGAGSDGLVELTAGAKSVIFAAVERGYAIDEAHLELAKCDLPF